jgi:anti-sigma B factor antagonist
LELLVSKAHGPRLATTNGPAEEERMLAAGSQPLNRSGGDDARVQVTQETEGIVAISLEGEFDLANSTLIREQAERALDDQNHLIINLSQATFIDSSTIHTLVQTHNGAVERGQVVVLQLATATAVERVLEIAGIVQHLPRAGTRSEAVETIHQLAVTA